MKFFVDTAEIKEISELSEMNLVDGVTTNPSLIAKSGNDIKETIKNICELVPGHVCGGFPAGEIRGWLEGV